MPFFICCSRNKVTPLKIEEQEISTFVPSVQSVVEKTEPDDGKLMFSHRIEIDRVNKSEKDAPEDKVSPKRVTFDGYKKSSRAKT